MRLFSTLVLGFALFAGAARAASPEDDYIAARDRAIAMMARLGAANAKADKMIAAQDKARADLAKRLETILGPSAIAGFPTTAQLNLESLSAEDIGFGMLDGLVFSGKEYGPRLVVTTRGLVERWLKRKSATKDASLKLPADVGAALASDTFYTLAIGSDAAFSKTVDFAAKKPEGAEVLVARLGGWAQDIGPNPNQEIIVALVKGGRVLIADEPLKAPLAKIPACEAVWAAANKAAEDLQKAYQDSGLKDEKLFARSKAAEEKGDKDYRACVGERLPHEATYASLVAQAQDLADRLSK